MPADRSHYLDIPTAVERERRAARILASVPYPPSFGGDSELPSTVHRAQRVPLPAASALLQPRYAINFRNLCEGSVSRGVRLADLFRRDSEPENLDGAADTVQFELGGDRKELKVIINWPGYEPESSTISAVSVDGGPLTRRELGKEIMFAYGRFFSKVVKEKIVPSQVGYYNIAPYQGQESQGSTPCSFGVQFSHLHLVKLREPVPGDDHWLAEIDIVQM